MNSVMAYFSLLLCGACSYALVALWRVARARWEDGPSLFKKVTKPVLLALSAGLALYTLQAAAAEGMSGGPALLVFLAGAAAPWYLARKGREAAERPMAAVVTEGVLDAKTLAKQVKAEKKPTYLDLSGVPLPVAAETTHFLLLGTSNKDKAAVLGSLLDQVRERGDTAIVLDAGGAVMSRHFAADTDFVLNPFDERCVSWSPVHEAGDEVRASASARCLVPSEESGATRGLSAQGLVARVLEALGARGDATHKELLESLLDAPRESLQLLVGQTPLAAGLGNEHRLEAVRAELRRQLHGLQRLPGHGDAFSVTAMLDAQHSGVLFVTYRHDQLDESRRVLTCVFDAAARAVLNTESTDGHRIWFIVDDISSLDRLPSMEALVSKARRSGAGLVLGAESLSDLRRRYGDTLYDTILGNLGTRLVTRCTDLDEAAEIAELLGVPVSADDVEIVSDEAEPKSLFMSSKPKSKADKAKKAPKAAKKPAAKKATDGPALVRALTEGRMLLKLVGPHAVCELPAPADTQDQVTAGFVSRRGTQIEVLASTPAASLAAATGQDAWANDMGDIAPVVHKRATGRLLDEPELEVVELEPEPIFGSEAEAAAHRARKTQEELRRRAAALGIEGFGDAEDIDFVDVGAARKPLNAEPVEEASVAAQETAWAQPAPEPAASDDVVTVVVEPETSLADEISAEPASQPLTEPQSDEPHIVHADASTAQTQPELQEPAAVEPVLSPATRGVLREGRDGKREERREGGRDSRREAEGRGAAPARAERAPGAGKPPAGGQKKPEPAPRRDGPKQPGGSGERPKKAGPAKGGKAHDMLRDLLR